MLIDSNNALTVVFFSDCVKLAYLSIDDKIFSFEDPVAAIDTCFKIIHSLNVKYSQLCESIWVFIQKFIYRINSSSDSKYRSVINLINELDKVFIIILFFD